jgi:hypothetical protein
MAYGIAHRRTDGMIGVRVLTKQGQQIFRANRFRQRAAATAADVRWRSMLTLTFDPKKIPNSVGSPKEVHKYAMSVWKRFRARMWKGEIDSSGNHRLYRFRYLAVVEWDSGTNRPHFHILIDRFLPASLVRRHWSESGGGVQVHFSYIPNHTRSRRAVQYVLKYITKSLTSAISGCRRWMVSNGILPPIKKSAEGEYIPVTWSEVREMNRHEAILFYGDEDGEETILWAGEIPCDIGHAALAAYIDAVETAESEEIKCL